MKTRTKAFIGFIALVVPSLSLPAARRVPGPPDPEVPRRVAAVLSETAHVSVHYWNQEEKKESFFAVTDKSWIDRLGAVLASAEYQATGHLFAVGPPIEFFHTDGHRLLKIQVFDSIVRVEASDYEVGKSTCDALRALIKEQKANHAPQTTPVSAPR